MVRTTLTAPFLAVAILTGCGDDGSPALDGDVPVELDPPDAVEAPTPDGTDTPRDDGDVSAPADTTASDSPLGPSLAGVRRFAIVSTTDSRSDGGAPDVSSVASFWRLAEPFRDGPSSSADESDVCEENALATGAPTLPENLLDTPEDARAVSAGETVQLGSPEGTWATLSKSVTEVDLDAGARAEVHEGGILYGASDLSGPIPSALSLDVPGDDYPATRIELPAREPRLEIADRETLVNQIRSGVLRWTPTGGSTDVESILTLLVSHVDRSSFTVRGVACTLVDDGEFELPESVRSLIADGLDINFLVLSRVVFRTLVPSDEALFHLQHDLDTWVNLD